MSFIVTREKRSHKADSIRSAAADLRAAGYSLCRINPNEKRPTYEEWPTRSLEPKEFGPDDLLGIICGPLSDAGRPGHALVVVDLDQPDAMNLATEFLPPTERIVGRRSKPRAHWYYLVPLTSIPEWAKSPAEQGATAAKDRTGHPGPFKKQFRHRETNVGVIDFVGTGGQVVAPHSLHPSGEIREWSDEPPGEPAVVEFPALWAAVCKLAAACGCEIPKIAHASVLPPTPRPESVEQAIAYLGNMSPAVSGSGGHGQLFAAARAVVWGFELGPEVGFDVLRTHYNPRCSPPWSDSELRHKCEEANRISFDRPRGDLNDSGEPSASNSDAGAPEVCLAIKPDGKRMHKVTVTANGVPVTVDTVNLGTATGRKRVLDAVVEKIPGANRKDLEAELVRAATGTDPGAPPRPSSTRKWT
ncbi:Phage/plasmid primase, P4 family, C-terminal domain protein OS=Singulisphaera acidiphila (strain ATCC BAA-1392 / DSM 18658 / VKM B-2454 / MOB10) GN=Sinac_4213 PE=4 SV=1: Prim-Pol [Gemmata massiliana]|uniref:DNA primase/polymerase bifunctional N-terminal domain-containing protein n=1 Tax=Gemmata massiliana TaxID=1210884 RepID=A0A6P2CYU2_9BACT|nr:bifunctional DNA primase/polymerase [Gemmata massiliana]VTR94141.1 Phage/plasmid primase, P4 family, C-terminal domain protein OS=Singulisphaera acidiphila (strain ATCC BAA-1392 / DSM 18658 / VKM B-2454 / MOB10) GN=Sinac_4213 PE=4 SV=1: Prim-Pol [Gemmata massiliana]